MAFFNVQTRITWANKTGSISDMLGHANMARLYDGSVWFYEKQGTQRSLGSLWTQSWCNKHHSVSTSRHGIASFQKNKHIHHPCGPLYRRRLGGDGESVLSWKRRILYSGQKIFSLSRSTIYTFWLVHPWYSRIAVVWPLGNDGKKRNNSF